MGALLALLVSAPLSAAPVDQPYRYTVRNGDTLYTLAARYLSKTGDFQTVQRLNKIADPYHLPPGMVLLIPDALLRTEPVIGEIASFRGVVTVDNRPVAVGTSVRQGMRVETGANAFVTVRLPDGSSISLPSQSRIRIDKLRRVLLSGGLDRNFVLEAGRSRSTVTPILDPASNFRVTTPLSVSAVRGTDFRVAFDAAEGRALTEVVGGTVGVAPDADKDQTEVPKAFGVIGTAAGIEGPIALLPPPVLLQMERTATGMVVTIKPIEGAARYRVQLATDTAFKDVFDEAVTEQPSASFTLSTGVSFYVRLTAIAPSGLEGLPATFALGQRIAAASGEHPSSMTGNDRTEPASGPGKTLR